MPPDHVTHVQLGGVVGAHVEHLEPGLLERAEHRLALRPPAGDLDAGEHLRLVRSAPAVVELGDAAPPERGAEVEKAAGPLGNGDGEQRLAALADLGALGDVAQAIEVDVRAR